MQTTSHLLMIEPVNFGFNTETAINNSFQKDSGDIQQKALEEFRGLVSILQQNKLDVLVVKDTETPYTPDSIFPNNWISFHEDGNVFLYPMFSANRRLEKKQQVLNALKERFSFNETIDLSDYEERGYYLEGTGSMVLDRINRIAYACLSPRTSTELIQAFCNTNQYRSIEFIARDRAGANIYHTNVMMCVADRYAVICLSAITDQKEKENIVTALQNCSKEIIDISMEQLYCFAGNMLQVINAENELLLLMSTQAYESLNAKQIEQIEKYNRIVHSPLYHIEAAGGGSARCMIAEIFLPPK